MQTDYELWLTNDFGVQVSPLSTSLGLTASKAVNKIAWFSLNIPPSFNANLLKPDFMVQVWRQPFNGVKKLWNIYFIRKITYGMSGSKETILIEGPDLLDLLWRRIVAAFAGSSNASMSDYGDDMMKAIVRDSQLDTIAPIPTAGTRIWDDFSVQADLSLGPQIEKSFAWDYLLTPDGGGVLPTLSKACKIAGTDVYFYIRPSIITPSSLSVEFCTTVNQIGTDLSDKIIFNIKNGNLKNPVLTLDYSNEKNYIYSGGADVGAARNIQQVYDSTRYNRSRWGRCEGFVNASNEKGNDGVINAGRSKLKEGEPKIKFTADLLSTEGTTFGKHWDLGDWVTVQHRNIELVSNVSVITLSVDSQGEVVQGRVDYQS